LRCYPALAAFRYGIMVGPSLSRASLVPPEPCAAPPGEQAAKGPSGSRRARIAPATLVAVLLLAVGFALRLHNAGRALESPNVDEKDVVEQAVAFMGGDLRFYFLRYGPLTMYVLAAIYHAFAALHGLSALDYAARVFFEGSEHYFVARAFAGAALSGLALVAFHYLRRDYGSGPALLACALLALPAVDTLVKGVRIDMVQAAFQGCALLALGEAAVRSRRRDWVLAGLCAGLGIASKPLPGLLVLPCFPLASWWAVSSASPASASAVSGGAARHALRRLAAALVQPRAWLAALACAAAAFACNPAMLQLREFVADQRETMAVHTGNVMFSTQRVPDSFLALGVPFVLCACAALVLLVVRANRKGLLCAAFVVLYAGAFWTRASRDYYMVAPVVAACLVIAHGYGELGRWLERERARRWLDWAWAPLAAWIVATPVSQQENLASRPSHATAAREWIEQNVPSGTGIAYVGMRMVGPRLVATDIGLHKRWSHSFDYGRRAYPFLASAYRKAYEDYVASGRPRYVIEPHDEKPLKRGNRRVPKLISDGLVRRARELHQSYIVLCGIGELDVHDLGYTWLGDALLEQQFYNIAIFRVPDVPVVAPEPAAPSLELL
jgi:hypothetical protein